MKQYEVRTKDLKTVIESLPDAWSVREAIAWKNERSIADYVLVLHEFETPAEADAARLDWMEANNGSILKGLSGLWCVYGSPNELTAIEPTLRAAVDAARQAPEPSVRVIATPDGPVYPA